MLESIIWRKSVNHVLARFVNHVALDMNPLPTGFYLFFAALCREHIYVFRREMLAILPRPPANPQATAAGGKCLRFRPGCQQIYGTLTVRLRFFKCDFRKKNLHFLGILWYDPNRRPAGPCALCPALARRGAIYN